MRTRREQKGAYGLRRVQGQSASDHSVPAPGTPPAAGGREVGRGWSASPEARDTRQAHTVRWCTATGDSALGAGAQPLVGPTLNVAIAGASLDRCSVLAAAQRLAQRACDTDSPGAGARESGPSWFGLPSFHTPQTSTPE